MREGIGTTLTLNIIIIFIVIVFGLLSATVNYYKAFKVNSYILSSIDKYEGYNERAKTEIADRLEGFGYFQRPSNSGSYACPSDRNGAPLVAKANGNADIDSKYFYCVYYYEDDTSLKNETNKSGQPRYYNYSVISYISLDLPIAGILNIPVHTKGERIYRFSSGGGNSWKNL